MVWLELVGLVVIVLAVVAGLLWGLEHTVPYLHREHHNDVAGFVYAVLGVLYAVMLGFVVVDEWGSLDTADHNTFTEANELGALYWNARSMPPDVGRDLEATTKEYAEVVISKEWPLLNNGGYSTEATELVYRMRDEVNALPVETMREQTLFDQSLAHVNNLAAARRIRLNESSDNVPVILWVALIVGGALTIGYTFLFGLSRFWSHFLISGPLATLVALAIAVISLLDHPFTGRIAVHPEAFEIFLRGLPAQR